jgi:pimeloyl-ACP methyl ester carboxylesterase
LSVTNFIALGAASLFAALAGASGLVLANIAKTYPPTGRFVDADGALLHVTLCEPQGPQRGDVVLLHGASGNEANMMQALGPALTAAGFRVLAFDRPGHGWSAPAAENARLATQARLLTQAAKKLGAARPIVIAHSFAGAVAMAMADKTPDFAEGYVLISPLVMPFTKKIAWRYRVSATPVIGQIFAYAIAPALGALMLDSALDSVFAPQRAPADFSTRTAAPLALMPPAFLANARDVVAVNAQLQAQAPNYPAIQAPFVLVSGDADDVVSPERHARPLSKILPRARLILAPGVGHSPHWVAPELVLAAVEEIADEGQTGHSGGRSAPENSSSAPGTSAQ